MNKTILAALAAMSMAVSGPALAASKKEDSALSEVRVPEAITERLEQLQGAVWQSAVEEADRRLVAEREALHQAQEQAAAEGREHLDSIKALETEAEAYQRKIETLEDVSNSLDADRHNAQADLAQVKAEAEQFRRDTAEAIIKETERREAAEARAERAEALHREAVEQARADLAALKAEHRAELEAVKTEAAGQVKDAQAKVQEQARQTEKAEKQAQQHAAAEQSCQTRLQSAQRELEQMQARMTKLEDKAEKATTEAAELRGEVKALRAGNGKG